MEEDLVSVDHFTAFAKLVQGKRHRKVVILVCLTVNEVKYFSCGLFFCKLGIEDNCIVLNRLNNPVASIFHL